MPRPPRLSTRVLLICAAVGVATGLVSALAGYVSTPVLALSPVLYGVVLAAHLLPGAVAQALLRQRWVALVAHLMAALIGAAVSPHWIMNYLLALVVMGGVQELVAALFRYRSWGWPMFLTSGAAVGVVLGLSAGLAIGLKHFGALGTIATVGVTVVAAIGWTFVGTAASAAVRRAGVGRLDRP